MAKGSELKGQRDGLLLSIRKSVRSLEISAFMGMFSQVSNKLSCNNGRLDFFVYYK